MKRNSVAFVTMALTIFVGAKIAAVAQTEAGTDVPDLQNYIYTNRLFPPPARHGDTVSEAEKFAKANPTRFEAHLRLALALAEASRFEEAVAEFRETDRLASEVKDTGVLSTLKYENVYCLCLFGVAQQKYEAKKDPIGVLRMMQQVIGMQKGVEPATLDPNLIGRAYLIVSMVYMQRGSYDAALRCATEGQGITVKNGEKSDAAIYDVLIEKLKSLKLQERNRERTQTQNPNKATERD